MFWRLHCLTLSALKLSEPTDFQSRSAASRSAIEIYSDIELVHRNLPADAVARFHAFSDTQRLRAARNIVRFLNDNSDLDQQPSPYDPQREFIGKHEARIDKQTAALWGVQKNGAPVNPDHWTGRDLKARAASLGKDFEWLVHEGYDHRNWLIHME